MSQPGDALEREADEIADRVVGSSRPAAARQKLRGDLVARSATRESRSAAPKAAAPLRSSTTGQPLDSATRGFFESNLGHDFSQVRIHAGAAAAQSARNLHANAYTLGRDITFGADQFAPQTRAGRRLLAHELAHVMQQDTRRLPLTIQREPADAAPVTKEQVEVRTPGAGFLEQVIAGGPIDDQIAARQGGKGPEGGVLGALDLSEVPDDSDELLAVKRQILCYFDIGTSNAEVDVVIAPNTTRRVFYTFVFDQSSNVKVSRLGESSDGPQLDPLTPDIARTADYPGAKLRPLKQWLGERYPALSDIEGESAEELRENANTAMRERCTRPQWFVDNYGIRIFDQAATESRQSGVGMYKPEQLAGIKDFTADELVMLELALEPMTRGVLAMLNETAFGRQDVDRLEIKDGQVQLAAEVGARTFCEIFPCTILVYDRGMRAVAHVFGSASGLHLASSRVLAHEAGHVIEDLLASTEFKEILSFVEGESSVRLVDMPQLTWYASAHPDRESFAEAFSLYQADPLWLQTHEPQVFAWFEILMRDLEKRRKKSLLPVESRL